ncbi:MAG: diguanylate cyclase [Solirubrobacterales bacterium]
MQSERTREALRFLERAAVDHLGWLMRVHAALIFPYRAEAPPCSTDEALPEPCPDLTGEADLAPLWRCRSCMHAKARELLDAAQAKGRVDPADYHTFVMTVDNYGREARRIETHLRRLLIETDPLTGVHNRQGMLRDIRREWTRALRTGRPVCVAIADLDWFKQVNDTYGHVAGDKVLCTAARFFVRRLRPYDMVFRYGGEEFLFCLPDTDAETARRVLDRLRAVMARLPVTMDDGTRLPVTCSIGVAQMVPGRSVHEAITAADQALYAAKDAGRNRVVLAPSDDEPAPAPATIAARLHPIRGAVRH